MFECVGHGANLAPGLGEIRLPIGMARRIGKAVPRIELGALLPKPMEASQRSVIAINKIAEETLSFENVNFAVGSPS